MGEESKYQTVSVPKEILEAIKELIAELKYWPSVTSFAREALLEKIKQEKAVLKEIRKARGEEVE
ncbi:MAG: ribbon-helix-helix domain-containing protein [Candidatus Bathyarchaeota archaeon]|nr:ribbon-helix-helix domain-containing protein [Candidatus Bathyarchaeota archaeon]